MTKSTAIHQDIAASLADRIGEGGLQAAALQAEVARTAATLKRLREEWQGGRSALLALPGRSDDLGELEKVAADWRSRFKRVVLFGIGGSSLGARTLSVLATPDAPQLLVPDSLGDAALARALDPAAMADTGFLLVSKSGGTAEPLAQALPAVEAVAGKLGEAAVGRHFLAVTEATDNPVRRLAQRYGMPVLEHDPEVGGRFSVLSLVGLLPALLLGLDARAIRRGAAEVLEAALASSDPMTSAPAVGASLNVAFSRDRGVSQSVLLCYAEGLSLFTRWYRQLWAESLGKEGKGTTPVDALGPEDQHSQLQLYLDGPADKFFTLLAVDSAGKGPLMPAALAEAIGVGYLGGRTVGDLVDAEARATGDTLAAAGRPVRTMRLAKLDERGFGALFMHFILETIIAADLLGVDPFGQPAVEQGKVLARKYLAEMG